MSPNNPSKDQEQLERLWLELSLDERMWLGDYIWNSEIDRKLANYKPSRVDVWLNRWSGFPLPMTCAIFKKPLGPTTERVRTIATLMEAIDE